MLKYLRSRPPKVSVGAQVFRSYPRMLQGYIKHRRIQPPVIVFPAFLGFCTSWLAYFLVKHYRTHELLSPFRHG